MANPDQRPRLQCFSGVHPAAMASPSRESRPLSGEPAVHHFVTGESADYWMYFRKEALNVVIEPALYFVRRKNDNGFCTHIQFKSSPYAYYFNTNDYHLQQISREIFDLSLNLIYERQIRRPIY